jgi:hypothetical protein
MTVHCTKKPLGAMVIRDDAGCDAMPRQFRRRLDAHRRYPIHLWRDVQHSQTFPHLTNCIRAGEDGPVVSFLQQRIERARIVQRANVNHGQNERLCTMLTQQISEGFRIGEGARHHDDFPLQGVHDSNS